MGIFHLFQAILMLLLSNNFTLPINTNFLQFNEFSKSLVPVTENIANIRIGPLVASFLFLSALAHITVSLPKIYQWYKKNLSRSINYARWWEYSISSSIMIVVIAMLTGIYDIGELILIFGLNAMMIFCGMIMEIHNQTTKKTNWTSFLFGCFAGIIPWIVIFLHLFGSGEGENKAPKFVYYIFFSIFAFFNVFAINMILQYKKVWKWKNYLFGEKVYILLSLLAKSALAWQVFAGTLRPV